MPCSRSARTGESSPRQSRTNAAQTWKVQNDFQRRSTIPSLLTVPGTYAPATSPRADPPWAVHLAAVETVPAPSSPCSSDSTRRSRERISGRRTGSADTALLLARWFASSQELALLQSCSRFASSQQSYNYRATNGRAHKLTSCCPAILRQKERRGTISYL